MTGVGPRDETSRQWLVGLVVAVAGIVISAVVTLVAAGKLPCPICGDSPPAATTPAPRPLGAPSFSVTPTHGTVPTTLTGTVTGFGPNEPITVTVDGNRIASVQADSAGAATSFPINMPGLLGNGTPRDITLMAQGGTTGTVKSATFHIAAP
jgi:hypothetical protein